MPSFEFTGGDPIDHHDLGRIEPGDVVEFDDEPAGEWKPTKKKAKSDSASTDDKKEG
jgi:hypothetical protein